MGSKPFRALIVAGLLLAVSSVLLVAAAWSWSGEIGEAIGVLKPGEFTTFLVDFGVIYAGESKTLNASSIAHVPVDASITFWAQANASAVDWEVKVYRNGAFIGTITPDHNVTDIVEAGTYNYTFKITVGAPVDLEEETPFNIIVYAEAGEV